MCICVTGKWGRIRVKRMSWKVRERKRERETERGDARMAQYVTIIVICLIKFG